MSNNRGAGAPTKNGPTKDSGPTADDTRSFFNEFNTLQELIEKLAKDTKGRQGYEQLQQQLQSKSKEAEETRQQAEAARDQHKSQIEELKTELAEQKKFNETLHDSQRDRAVAWNTNTQRLELESAELSRVKEELKRVQDELDAITDEKNTLQQEHSRLNRDVRGVRKKLEELQADNGIKKMKLDRSELDLKLKDEELQKSREVLSKLHDDLGFKPLKIEKMGEYFEDLASNFHRLVWNTFSNDQDVPENALVTNVSGTVHQGIPQVASNSQVARYMRCALAEAKIAETLSTDVFQDTFLGDSLAGEDLAPLLTAMRKLRNGRHTMQATIIKWQLVKVCQESDTAREVASKASQSVCQILGPWLGDPKMRASAFAQELDRLFSEAVVLWQTIQRTRTHAKVVMSLEEELWNYTVDSYREYDEIQRPEQDPQSSITLGLPGTGPVAVLFPQIRADNDPSDQSDDDLIYPGYALFPTQSAFIAARAERSAHPTMPTLRRSSTTDRRRWSKTKSQEGQAEARRPTSRRMSTSSRDGVQQKSVMGTTSDSEKGSVLSSVLGRAGPTASVSSTRSRRSGSAAHGGG